MHIYVFLSSHTSNFKRTNEQQQRNQKHVSETNKKAAVNTEKPLVAVDCKRLLIVP